MEIQKVVGYYQMDIQVFYNEMTLKSPYFFFLHYSFFLLYKKKDF